MKKLLFCFAAVLAVSLSVNAQIYTQDFEDSTAPDEWTAEVDGPGSWEFGGDTTPGGVVEENEVDPFDSNAAIYDDDANGSGADPSVATLSSPVFTGLSGEVMMSFEYACNFYPMDAGGTFYVELFDGADWVEVLSATSMVQPTVFELDVSEYAEGNDDFQVRFVFDDEGNWSWGAGVNYFYLDGVLGVSDENNKNSFGVYPNPVKDVAQIRSLQDIKQLSLYDVIGKQVLSDNNVKELNLSKLSAGVYVLKAVLADGSVISQKIIKK